MKKYKPYLILFLALFYCHQAAFCQGPRVQTKDLSLQINDFYETDRDLLNNQFAVKAGIVPPINLSKAPLELRIYKYTLGAGTLQLISVEQDTVKAAIYYWHDISTRKDFVSSAGTMYKYSISLKGAPLHLDNHQSWQDYFNELHLNHLFSIPGQNLLTIEVLKANGGTTIAGADMAGRLVIELKVNDAFRVVEYDQRYEPEPVIISDYNYLLKINNLFNDLKP
ncbi:MAG: hypothetical protein JWQ57_2401 [Mucilaginibacter sp.]|nr:hypothetical protein [Mucilaginibacter sp.]